MSERECIVHIGMDKTGSTSIQRSLYRNASLQGAHYLDVGHYNSGRALEFALLDDPTQAAHARRAGTTADAAAQKQALVLASLRAEPARMAERLLVSGEQLSYLKLPQVERLRQLLSEPQRRVRAVAYVRGARGYMESSLQQAAKKGKRLESLQDLMPKYQTRFKPHVEVFGAGAVDFWHFAPQAFPEQCVVRDFCARLGLGLSPESILRVRESVSRSAVSLLMLFWRTVGERPGAKLSRPALRLKALVRELPGPKCRLSPEALEPLFKRERAQIDWMQERLGLRLDELGEAHPEDIRSVNDLYQLTPETQQWLEEQLGESLGKSPKLAELSAAVRKLALAEPKRNNEAQGR